MQNISTDVKSLLLSDGGLEKSRINLIEGQSKFKQRSPSQLSIATTLLSNEDNLPLESDLTDSLKPDIEKWIDDSKLSVLNVTYAKTNELLLKQQTPSLSDNTASFEQLDASDYSNITIGSITESCAQSVRSESLADNLDRIALSDDLSEKSYSCLTDDRSVNLNLKCDGNVFKDVDIGGLFDADVPLVYLTRYIAKSFLLTGFKNCTIPDKVTRVSVKSLALNCLSEIFKIYPKGLLLSLEKRAEFAVENQEVSDVFLYANHEDPQLRGASRILIGTYIKAALLEGDFDYEGWVRGNFVGSEGSEHGKFAIRSLLDVIFTVSITFSVY